MGVWGHCTPKSLSGQIIAGPRQILWAEVVQEVRKIRGVKAAHALYGALEAIALVEAADLKDLDRVIAEMYRVEGLRNTDTRMGPG